jgi:phosphoribosylformimino-5-aminoimidazole carboxamide ribotide isomerase
MHIIPAIDIIEGKCVRLTQGDYDRKKVYNENPLEVAMQYEDAGLTHLHVVDLDGAKAKRIINYKVLERITARTRLKVDFGGGLKSDEDIRIAFESGAHQVTGGTVAVKDPDLFLGWLRQYGSERIILGSDFKDGKIAVGGWQEQSERELMPFLADYMDKGVRYTICTDVSKDGLLQGSAVALYREIRAEFPGLKLIASGGITSMEELEELHDIGCYGAIIGKAIYEGYLTMADLTAAAGNLNP